MIRGRFLSVLLALLLILTGSLAGCGKKANPRPSTVQRPPAVSDLSAAPGAAGAGLRWSVPEAVQGDWTFQVQRSESVDTADFCPGCPQTYRLLRTLKLDDGRLQRIGERAFGFDDADLREGWVYLYRVTVCRRDGSCGKESNPAGPVRSGR